MESKDENLPNGESESPNHIDEETSEEHTASDEQEVDLDEAEVKPTTSTGRLSSSQHRRMRKKKTPAENNMKWRQFYNLRRGRSDDVTPSEVLAEVAADKNVDQRLNGWKLSLVGDQMDAISDFETRNIEQLSRQIIAHTHPRSDTDCDEDDVMVFLDHRRQYHQMIEQCKLVREKMQYARLHMMRIMDHKPHVSSIVERVIRDMRKRDDGDYC